LISFSESLKLLLLQLLTKEEESPETEHSSNVKFDELQFNLFVAGELEIISNKKIDEIEKNR
jgi:hypothetical protein